VASPAGIITCRSGGEASGPVSLLVSAASSGSSETVCPVQKCLPVQQTGTEAQRRSGECGETRVMVLALGRKKQRVLIALSILPNLFLAFLLSSDPLITLSPHHHCRLPGPLPSPEVLNASLPWEKGERPGDNGAPSQCKQYANGSQSSVVDCEAGWDYNVTEGLKNNIVTEVQLRSGLANYGPLQKLHILPSLFVLFLLRMSHPT
uniref:Uncharacterized protein n=1 Tax=Acanthochromis polyacanthus TaxID=80966 RepID=A0A3Q1F981_9TELE